MNIILDTNIIMSDYLLKNNEFLLLFDYLKKTDSSLLFPQIIIDEVLINYKNQIKEVINNLNKANKKLLGILPDYKIIESNINEEEIIKNYFKYLKDKLNLKDNNILSADNNFLSEITQRAIEKKKPFKENGDGFKDTLIWIIIRDYCKKTEEKQITFISKNYLDFGNKDDDYLNEILLKECEEIGIKINYYKSINDFIKVYCEKIIDIFDVDWLSENLDDNWLIDAIIEYLSEDINMIDEISNIISEDCFEFNIKYVSLNKYNDLFINDLINNEFIINFSVIAYIDIEFEYRYFDGFNFDFDFDRNSFNFKIKLLASVLIKNNKVEKIDFYDYDFLTKSIREDW